MDAGGAVVVFGRHVYRRVDVLKFDIVFSSDESRWVLLTPSNIYIANW